jgi:carbon monoxide dehydrogenase subunit G
MTGYRFETTWPLPASREAVWAVVDDVERWPSWWPGVAQARVLPSPDGGRRLRLRFRSALGYSLAFTAVVVRSEPPVTGSAEVDGHLRGTGTWRLTEVDGGTRLDWTWAVEPRVRWLRLLSPVARPVFGWAHARLMRQGRAGLVRRLAGGSLAHPPAR